MTTYAYVRYIDDKTKAIVPTSFIKEFHPSGPKDYDDKTKYYVKWTGDDGKSDFYKARILLLGASKENLETKLKEGRLRVRKVIDSSDYSEDSSTTEKENAKVQKKHIKERQTSASKPDLMKILEMKRKKMSATNSEKSELELLQEKYERAERRVLVLEKEARQLRQLNVNLQEIVIKKVESLMKGDERNCRCHFEAPPAPGAAPNHGAAQVVADDLCLVDSPAPAMSPPLAAAHALAPRPALSAVPALVTAPPLGAVLPRVAAVPLAAAPALAAGPPLPLAPPQLPVAHAPAANLQPAALPAMQNAGLAANADDMVDIGKGVLIDRSAWLQAQAKRDTVFVKDVAVAVAMYGPRVLLESSVLGRHCPKFPGREKKRPLCPLKFGVLKDLYVARLVSGGMPVIFAKPLAKDVTKLVNEKIGELKRAETRRETAAAAILDEDVPEC